MYKSFPITMITTHLYRRATQLDGLSRAKVLSRVDDRLDGYGSDQRAGETYSARSQEMSEPGFWGQAFTQGGGAGIFGDFIFSDQNRYGNS
jgi:hypothetical protein